MDTPPAVRVALVNGEPWISAVDLAIWAQSAGTEAGRELAEKVTRMAACRCEVTFHDPDCPTLQGTI